MSVLIEGVRWPYAETVHEIKRHISQALERAAPCYCALLICDK